MIDSDFSGSSDLFTRELFYELMEETIMLKKQMQNIQRISDEQMIEIETLKDIINRHFPGELK